MLRFPSRFRDYKLTAGAALLVFALSAYAAALFLGAAYWTPFFRAQSSSVISFSIVFLGVSVLLARRGVPDVETFSTSLAATVSVIWLYELIFHYSFISYLDYLRFPFFDFSDTSTLLMDGALSLLVLVGYRHIRVRGNRPFGLLMAAFSALYLGWLLIGFPQYDGTFQLPRFVRVGDPFVLGFLLNRTSKLILCLAWVSLFLGAPKRGEERRPTQEPSRPPSPAPGLGSDPVAGEGNRHG